MKTFMFGTALAAAAFAAPTLVSAQQLPPAVAGVVDSQRVLQGCTVCLAANQQLEAQQQQLRQRAQQLGLVAATENALPALETEGRAIQTAVSGLAQGQQPDAALTARAQAYQTNVQNAQREIAAREQQIRRNQAFVLEQIRQRVAPAIQQAAQARGATVVLDTGNIAWSSPAIDITPAVVAIVNQNATPLNVNAPAAAQQPAQQPQARPQGR